MDVEEVLTDDFYGTGRRFSGVGGVSGDLQAVDRLLRVLGVVAVDSNRHRPRVPLQDRRARDPDLASARRQQAVAAVALGQVVGRETCDSIYTLHLFVRAT